MPKATIRPRILVEQTKLDDISTVHADWVSSRTCRTTSIALLGGDGTCTKDSAALVATTCSVAGIDTDSDGMTDEAETASPNGADGVC